ncbi:MAG: ABC transporter permease [Sulfolobales archaeon]
MKKLMKKTIYFFSILTQAILSNKRILTGATIVSSLIIIAAAAPLITWYPPLKTLVANPFLPPNPSNPFGTDDLGRDIYTNSIYGLRTSLIVGALSTTIATLIGILIGAVAGYYGRVLGDVLMRITDMAFIIPSFLLALLIATILGPNIYNIMLAIGVTSWPGIARMTRAEFLRVKEQAFVEVARALGVSDRRIIFVHILPNSLPAIIPYVVLQMSNNILIEAGLGFLGISDPNIPSLGQLLNIAQQYLTTSWWIAAFPGLILSLLIIGFNLLGDGLIDYINPRLRVR